MIWETDPRGSIQKFVELGLIERKHFCECCGRRRILVAHHEDYFKPIDITWLCKPCHNNRHVQIGGHAKNFHEINAMYPQTKRISSTRRIVFSTEHTF